MVQRLPRVSGPLGPVRSPLGQPPVRSGGDGGGAESDFGQVLDQALSPAPVRLSGHAQQRLSQSGRSLSPTEAARVAGAVDQAARKGSRDALILLPDVALVVNVPSRTVITAVGQERMRDNVFTQIDAAVVL